MESSKNLEELEDYEEFDNRRVDYFKVLIDEAVRSGDVLILIGDQDDEEFEYLADMDYAAKDVRFLAAEERSDEGLSGNAGCVSPDAVQEKADEFAEDISNGRVFSIGYSTYRRIDSSIVDDKWNEFQDLKQILICNGMLVKDWFIFSRFDGVTEEDIQEVFDGFRTLTDAA